MNVKSTKKGSGSRTNKAMLNRGSDKTINYEDSPPTTEDFWDDAKVFMPQPKVHISLRVDKDILDYFKMDGPGYQSRINAVLKAYMKAHPH